jgi:lysophospholipase L1-like esterase
MINFKSIKNKGYLLFLCLVFVLASFSPSTVFGGSKIIIAFGDSLTEGCGNMDSPCGFIPRPGDITYDYEVPLQVLLSENNHDYTVINFGLGGQTTVSDLAYPYRFDSVINNDCNEDAKYILIMEGTNDLFHHVNKSAIQFNLGSMIDQSLAKGLIPLVATITPDKTPGAEYKGIPEMNTLIRQLVEEKVAEGKDVILVDQYNELEPDWYAYTNPRGCYSVFDPDDQLHPNASGFSAMGTVWYESLAAIFPRPSSLSWLMLLLSTP